MSKEQKVTKKTAIIEFGKFYIKKSDIWAIDSTHTSATGDYLQVYVRDQIFKMKPDQLVILEGDHE